MFSKSVSDEVSWWHCSVGHVFKRKGKHFIPVKILGNPLRKKSEIVHYLIYLELLPIPSHMVKT